MKYLVVFITSCLLLISGNSLTAKAIVCKDGTDDYIEYNRVSYDGGVTWQVACCEDFIVPDGFNCSDDCDETAIRKNENEAFVPNIERITYKYFDTQLDEHIEVILEIRKGRLLKNGETYAEIPKNATGIEISAKGLSQAIKLTAPESEVNLLKESKENINIIAKTLASGNTEKRT